ncbi:hypothetical protein [Polymorphospora sp. NPDC050346]|uniref:hypothetical protein n=1 Tax=Polymorphospora sp. NPDC050346 TaxID=3155780 RepID=UPI0033D1AE3A
MSDLHKVTVPAADADAEKPWRKLLVGLDESQYGARACQGHWLDPGAVYELAVGALIVGADRTTAGHRTRLWRVTRTGALTVERDSSFKAPASAFGDSVRGTLRTRLAKYPPQYPPAISGAPRLVTAAPPRANTRDDTCSRCGQTVPARAGHLQRGADGRSTVVHQPTCPPAPPPTPTPNRYAGTCNRCHSWVEAGAGILDGGQVRHPGACPPPAPPAPRRNQRPGPCHKCGQQIKPGDGILVNRYQVRHDGDCPPYPGGYIGPTWTIGYGVPAPFHPIPTSGYRLGEVRRAEVFLYREQVPETAPGFRRISDVRVSAIMTVIGEYQPTYSRDEDGDSPCDDLIGEDGWYYSAVVRPATDDEAAPLLAAEARAAHREDLEQRRQALLAWRYRPVPDATLPAEPDLTGTVRVPHRPSRSRSEEEIRVDEPAGVVWTLEYNGADGDDWSRNNHRGGYLAWSQPLTPGRAALIEALRAEYTLPDLTSTLRVNEPAAKALLAAGWTTDRAEAELGAIDLTSPADVAVLTDHRDLWPDSGWQQPVTHIHRRWPVADAVRLATAGVDPARARKLAAAGVPLAQMSAATAPDVPDGATRIIIRPATDDRHGHAMVTTSPDTARTWLATHPDHWHADAVTAHTGPTCVHTAQNWTLWDDGALLDRAWWIDHAEQDQQPRTLDPAAVTALDLVLAAGPGSKVADRAVWHPLRVATGHTATILDERKNDGGRSWSGKTLIRHDFTTPAGAVTWWELRTYEGGWGDGDADHNERSHVWPNEHGARTAYNNHQV